MAALRLPPDVIKATHDAMREAGGNQSQAAAKLGISRSTLQNRLRRDPVKPASIEELQTELTRTVPAEPAKTRVVLMTAVQDHTALNEGALANLQAYAAHRGGELLIGGFTYQKALFEENRVDELVKAGAFAHSVVPLLNIDVVDLAPRLQWYGRANILPTATDPLTGWDTNTRDKWAIFPHAKIALKCVPVMPGRPGKAIMTTGVITRPNYVQRNAGQKAEFHHTYGATIAEIKPNGTFYTRQIGMDKDGAFQDLDVLVKDGAILPGPPVEAITWGDIHLEEIDWDIAEVLWGLRRHSYVRSGNMLDELKPRHQFFHDSFSFKARSHHTIKDPHERGVLRQLGGHNESIKEMLYDTTEFLHSTIRSWSKSIHVPSNHNNHLHTWLKNTDAAADAENAGIWHKLNAAWWDAIDAGEGETFSAHAYALQHGGLPLNDVLFLHQGQSYLICQDTAPIECGLHGDVGPRGSRGSPSGLAKIVERVNTAHTHEPRILEAAYVAGTSSRLDLKYASKGPGAWHHAEVVTYASGKRTIVFPTYEGYRA
jgi:hypothetical protein